MAGEEAWPRVSNEKDVRCVLSAPAQLSTLAPMTFGTVLRAADLELALRKAEVADQAVPKHWDGASITLHTGSTVVAEWPDITLMQGSPPVVSTPPGFDLSAFVTALLRGAGMDRESAHRLGQRMATTPALLLGIGVEDAVTIRDVALRTGPATLIEDSGENNEKGRVTLIWSVPDRVYVLTGAISTHLAIAIANSVE